MTQDFSGDVVEESTPGHLNSSPSLFRFFIWSHVVIAGLVAYIGGLFVHGWTTYLFFENWGLFWAFMAFSLPLFSELVAIVACFWWGVWFYVLAVAAIIVGMLSFSFADEASELMASKLGRRLFGVSAIALYTLLGCFGFFAVRAANLPRPLSVNDRQEIEDVSCAVCGVLKNCWSSDSAVMAGLVGAKDRLHREIADFDTVRSKEVKRAVDAYLRTYLLIERDSKAYFLSAEQSNPRFSLGVDTREAIGRLPLRMQATDAELEAEVQGAPPAV